MPRVEKEARGPCSRHSSSGHPLGAHPEELEAMGSKQASAQRPDERAVMSKEGWMVREASQGWGGLARPGVQLG